MNKMTNFELTTRNPKVQLREVGFKRIIKKPEDLRQNKQHIVVYETKDSRDLFAESCNNCFVVHHAMTVNEWAAMIEDFVSGQIDTLIIHKTRMQGWYIALPSSQVDIVYTYRVNFHEIQQGLARLRG